MKPSGQGEKVNMYWKIMNCRIYRVRGGVTVIYYIITHQRNPELPWRGVKATEDVTGAVGDEDLGQWLLRPLHLLLRVLVFVFSRLLQALPPLFLFPLLQLLAFLSLFNFYKENIASNED